MSDSPNELDPRQIARHYTARLKEILSDRIRAGEIPPEPPATAPLSQPAGEGQRTSSPSVATAAAVQGVRPVIHPVSPQSEPVPHPSLPAAGIPSGPLVAVGERLRRPQGRFADLLAQVQRLNQLNQILRAFLPPYLHEHVTLARLDSEGWVVQTDSPAWAARLRYILPNLRQPLGEKLGIEVPHPQIRIAPPEVPSPPPSRRMIITDNTVKTLEEAAQQFSDPRLSAAIMRLAEHARQRNRES